MRTQRMYFQNAPSPRYSNGNTEMRSEMKLPATYFFAILSGSRTGTPSSSS